MTRRTPDPHHRFGAWLVAGADGDPPRDLALHASLCADCTSRIAAFDLLAATDPGRASLPASVATRRASALGGVARYAAAFAGVALLAVVVGVAASRLIDLRGQAGTAAEASETPAQDVLGGTGRPSPTPTLESQPSSSGTSSVEPSASQAPTSAPSAPVVFEPPPPPGATPRPPTPRPSATPRPSSSAVPPTPTPSPAGTPSGSPSATPTPVETPVPTPVPTPEPSPTPNPEPTPTPTV